jgi:hypothetical protein
MSVLHVPVKVQVILEAPFSRSPGIEFVEKACGTSAVALFPPFLANGDHGDERFIQNSMPF